MINLFSNRELASITLIIIVILDLIYRSIKYTDVRSGLILLIKTAFNKYIVIIFLISSIYFYTQMYLVNFFISLDAYLIKNALLWWLISGNDWIYKFALTYKKEDLQQLLKNVLVKYVSLTTIMMFVLSQYTFSFILELIIVCITSLFMYTSTKRENREHRIVHNFLIKILRFIFFLIIVYTFYHLYKHYKELQILEILISFLLPLVLSILWLPLLYIIVLYCLYERIFYRNKEYIQNNYRMKTIFYILLKCYLINIFSLLKIYNSMTREFHLNLEWEGIQESIRNMLNSKNS